MSRQAGPNLTSLQRRRAMRLAYVHGALWAMGNGLTTGPILTYFAQDLGADGTDVAYILVVPALVGLLRLVAPNLIRGLGGFKPAAFVLFVPSYVLVSCVPILAIPQPFPSQTTIRVFVVLICVHQLLEYTGTVAVWSWLAEIVPQRIRGRFFARRQRWQLIGLMPTLLASAWFVGSWQERFSKSDLETWAYAGPIGVGALFLLASLVPLARMPNVYRVTPAEKVTRFFVFAPFADARFQRLLLFGCWFWFFEGLTQIAQDRFPSRALGLDVLHLAWLRVLMQTGQISLTPWVGSFSDRYGNLPALVACQLVVAAAPLFYLAANHAQPWWIAGAWLAFSGFVGIYVCLPNLVLKLSNTRDTSAYVAAYFATTGAAYGVSLVAGDWLLDFLRYQSFEIGPFTHLDRYGYLFYVAWVTRTMGVVLLMSVKEPGAWTWREILRGSRSTVTPPGATPEAA